jgi:hypothetical protein
MRKSFALHGALLAVGWMILVSGSVIGQQTEVAERGIAFEEVKRLLTAGDTFEAIEYVNGQGVPETVAERYSHLVKDFYWKDKALPNIVTFARAGIQYCLTKAQEMQEDDAQKALQLRVYARVISYNLASFAWPGWDEEGIVITERDLVEGLDAARLNVRLTTELREGPEKLANAYWVLGAQLLAAANYDDAIAAFESCKAKAQEAEALGLELLARGYMGIAKIVEGQASDEGRALLDDAIQGLDEMGTEDSEFFISQLRTALNVFER